MLQRRSLHIVFWDGGGSGGGGGGGGVSGFIIYTFIYKYGSPFDRLEYYDSHLLI